MNNKQIKYYSTNLIAPEVTFREALLQGLAPDGGLYMPSTFPELTKNELSSYTGMTYSEIAFSVLNKFLDKEIDRDSLLKICTEAYNFEVPLEKICNRKYLLRLDQGPTASFKDFAARIMSRLMQYFLSLNNQYLTILTATSGDTGSAVANAFYGLNNIKVIILFPGSEVTDTQRKQMTTLKKNIKVISIDGKFDDCQSLVKKAFRDPDVSHLPLSSANSINIGRLLPQSIYYIYGWSRVAASNNEKVVFSVPSGNFGNLMAGLIASRLGLPVKKFIISTNDNNEVPEYLSTGTYKTIVPSKNCISSAMNVGHPSNLARIIALYGGIMNENGAITKEPDLKKMREDLYGVSFTDEMTRKAISEIYRKYNIILEPHGAIGWLGIKNYSESIRASQTDNQLYISLETAHPAKFSEEIRSIIDIDPPMPVSLSELTDKEEEYISLNADYSQLKEFILKNN